MKRHLFAGRQVFGGKMSMKTVLGGLLAIVTLLWGWQFLQAAPSGASLPWLVRQQGMYLTGLYSIALMSLVMILSTRPAWLERPLGGMDRVYRMHKWAGILAVSFAAAHWLFQMSDDVIKAAFGREGRLPKEKLAGLIETLRKLAEEMGEWAIYATLAMLVLTLWKRIPYRMWRHVHRLMPVLYLILAFHAVMLAPLDYWQQPVGAMLALQLAGGVFSCVMSLAGNIGYRRSVVGTVEAVKAGADVTEVTCHLDADWKGHRPGQFAFIAFDEDEGAHPFTIASADRGDRMITFQIKALGDYTRGLDKRLALGQTVMVEGPYGHFDYRRCNRRAQQIWIAGGIGVTPFLAWLDSLQKCPQNAPAADLHYCTRDRDLDAFVPRLEALCATLPSVRLHVHGASRGEVLTADTLRSSPRALPHAEVWFCGPQGLADSLKEGLVRVWGDGLRFHQEAFEMR
jgi:predicted ferric reductase